MARDLLQPTRAVCSVAISAGKITKCCAIVLLYGLSMQKVQTVPSVTRVLDIAVYKAKKSTFGFVGLNHTKHIGRLGDYPPRIAEEGMIGMEWLNGGGVFLARFGSADRRIRPEPIAFSASRRNGFPFVLDMTITVVAGGEIEQKLIRGEKMPDGWVIDPDGAYASDPA